MGTGRLVLVCCLAFLCLDDTFCAAQVATLASEQVLMETRWGDCEREFLVAFLAIVAATILLRIAWPNGLDDLLYRIDRKEEVSVNMQELPKSITYWAEWKDYEFQHRYHSPHTIPMSDFKEKVREHLYNQGIRSITTTDVNNIVRMVPARALVNTRVFDILKKARWRVFEQDPSAPLVLSDIWQASSFTKSDEDTEPDNTPVAPVREVYTVAHLKTHIAKLNRLVPQFLQEVLRQAGYKDKAPLDMKAYHVLDNVAQMLETVMKPSATSGTMPDLTRGGDTCWAWNKLVHRDGTLSNCEDVLLHLNSFIVQHIPGDISTKVEGTLKVVALVRYSAHLVRMKVEGHATEENLSQEHVEGNKKTTVSAEVGSWDRAQLRKQVLVLFIITFFVVTFCWFVISALQSKPDSLFSVFILGCSPEKYSVPQLVVSGFSPTTATVHWEPPTECEEKLVDNTIVVVQPESDNIWQYMSEHRCEVHGLVPGVTYSVSLRVTLATGEIRNGPKTDVTGTVWQ